MAILKVTCKEKFVASKEEGGMDDEENEK